MAVEHMQEVHFTVDGGSDLSGEISAASAAYLFENVDVTNLGSSGLRVRHPTLTDFEVSVTLSNPESDESAAGLLKALYDGSTAGGGDSKYAIVIQKVSSGGTGGTATTKDPTYAATMTVDRIPVVSGAVDTVVLGGETVTFSNASATVTRATA